MGFLPQPITLQSLFGKDRKVGSITLQVVVSESTTDTLTITKQPVQQGASITDHAYKEPAVLTMTAHFKDNPSSFSGLISAINPFGGGAASGLGKIYQELLDLQSSRTPFDVVTLKRIYHNMLMASLGVTTDKYTENVLAVTMTFQEVILVSVSGVTVPRANQRNPGLTGAIESAGKKSALAIIGGA